MERMAKIVDKRRETLFRNRLKSCPGMTVPYSVKVKATAPSRKWKRSLAFSSNPSPAIKRQKKTNLTRKSPSCSKLGNLVQTKFPATPKVIHPKDEKGQEHPKDEKGQEAQKWSRKNSKTVKDHTNMEEPKKNYGIEFVLPLTSAQKQHLEDFVSKFPKDATHGSEAKLREFDVSKWTGKKQKRYTSFQKLARTKSFQRRTASEFNAMVALKNHLMESGSGRFVPARWTWKTALPPQTHNNIGACATMLVCCTGGTNDVVVCGHFKSVFEAMNYDFTFEKLSRMSLDKLAETIRVTSKWAKNAIITRNVSRHILKHHNGRVPKSIKALMKINGIRHKMASLIIEATHGKNTAIPTDRHVFRGAKALCWVKDAKSHDECALQMMFWLPSEHWVMANDLFGGFFQLLKKRELRDKLFLEAKKVSSFCHQILLLLHNSSK